MRTSGPRAFWLSFFITLGVVLPLMGSFALYAVWQKDDAAPAGQPQSGVPVRTPGPDHACNALVALAGESPAFVLLRLDAVQGALVVEALPGQSVLLGPNGPVLLADSYAAAGPARAAALLGETLGITVDRYLALTPDALIRALEGVGSVRLNLTGLLSEEEQASLGLAGPVQEYTPETAAAFLQSMDAQLAPDRAAALRAALWEAYLRQNLEKLPAALPDGLRAVSSRLLTNLDAGDLYRLGQTLNFLAARQTGAGAAALSPGDLPEGDAAGQEDGLRVSSGVLPGNWQPRTGRYEFSEEAAGLAAQLFGVQSEEALPEPFEGPFEGPSETDAAQDAGLNAAPGAAQDAVPEGAGTAGQSDAA